jgi:phosphoglucosamine mutase
MGKNFFGTDGVRGRVGHDPMNADFTMRLASAAAQVLVPKGGTVVIGKDTRLSGYMFESALEAGFVAAGADVLLLGPLPTPAIARLTQEFDADLGVVISASHNLFFDNGIKFFDRSGSKLTDEIEHKIEEHLKNRAITLESQSLGKAKRIDTARIRYQDFCISSMPDGVDLDGLKVVFDGANGAGYKVGPRTLMGLGADVIPLGCSPNGKNINDGCGSTEPELLQVTVPAVKADVGVALDGDGDRVVMVDESGTLVDGDQLLYVLATARKDKGSLKGPGDRYVLEMLRESGGVIGGETSGHMLVLDKTTTGDGLISALQVLAVMKETGKPLSELVAGMPRYPQTMINVRTEQRLDPGKSPEIQNAVAIAEGELADKGRVVLRASGTEPVIRVMVEGQDEVQVVSLAKRLASVVKKTAA